MPVPPAHRATRPPRPPVGAATGRRGRRIDLDGALLNTADLAALAGHAHTIAEHFGRPQDIEWALAADQMWIVQARPMTALPPSTPRLGRVRRLQATILTEYFPVRPYPLDVTTQAGHGPARMMRDIALHYGINGIFEDVLREEDGVVIELLPSSPRPTPRMLLAPVKLARNIRRFKPAIWASDPRQAAFLAEVDALESLDLATLPWNRLLKVPVRAMDAQDYCRDLRIDYLPGAALALARLVLLAGMLGSRMLVADLLGGARTRTEDSNRALAALAAEVRADPGLHSMLSGQDASHGRDALPVDALPVDSGYPGFRSRFESFLHEFGRRETTSPLLVSAPTLAESPGIVLGMVLAIAAGPAGEPEPASRSATSLQLLLGHRLLRGNRRSALARRWVQAARHAVAFREDTHFYFTAALPTLRRSLLEIGNRLHRAGVLHGSADVFHLRWEEIAGVRDDGAVPDATAERLRALVAQRTARRAELAGAPMIDPARVFPAAAASDALATGTPAGSGTATGVARIVRGAEDFEKLDDGEVLVCPYTNPSWTPLFRRAAAIVVDTGSAASHAAIVAREYSIPAVMGTGTGTTAIADGQRVTVDGTHGRITGAG